MRPAALIALLLLAAPAARADEEPRSWKDATGKFSITAKFVALSGGKVTLEKPDGSRFEIALDKLSPADRLVAEQKGKAGDDPFTPKSRPGAAPPAPAPTGPVDWSKARLVGLGAVPEVWKYAPAAPEGAKFEPYLDPIALPGKADFFDTVKGFALSAGGARAAVAVTTGRPGDREKVTRVSVIDLAAGSVAAAHPLPGDYTLLALSDDGERAVVRREEFATGGAAEVWSVGATAGKLAAFPAEAEAPGSRGGLKWAAFVAGNRVATLDGNGKLAVWDAATLRPLYQLPLGAECGPAVAPDRKAIAFAAGDDTGLFDASTGKVVALSPGAPGAGSLGGAQLAFSPSGRRLARLSQGKLTVFDAATGAARPATEVRAVYRTTVSWAGEEYVLSDGTLVEADTGTAVWSYSGAAATAPAPRTPGVVYFLVAGGSAGGPTALVPARLPGARVVAAAAKLKAKLAEARAEPDYVCMKPGTAVSIDAAKIADAGQRAGIVAALAEKLRANGQTVGEGGAVQLVAEMEVGKSRELSFRDFGGFGRGFGGGPFGRPEKTYSFTPHYSRLKFVYQNQVAWQAGAGGEPLGLVQLGPDETLEAHLKKLERPDFEFFRTTPLPKTLTKPGTAGDLVAGTSQVTAAGVR